MRVSFMTLAMLTRLLCAQVAIAPNDSAARFDPPSQTDLHTPGPEDAPILRILKGFEDPARVVAGEYLLVRGHFLGDGVEAAAVAGFRITSDGYAPMTWLLSHGAGGWRVPLRNDDLDINSCRVIPASPSKDILQCQTEYSPGPAVVNGKGEIDTDLYIVDFTRNPPDTTLLHLRDTLDTASACVSSASIESARFQNGSLRVLVRYGRGPRSTMSSGATVGLPSRIYQLEFTLGPDGMSVSPQSRTDLKTVTSEEGDRCIGTLRRFTPFALPEIDPRISTC